MIALDSAADSLAFLAPLVVFQIPPRATQGEECPLTQLSGIAVELPNLEHVPCSLGPRRSGQAEK